MPLENGQTRNLTNTSNAHERSPIWSYDGRWIAFFSDESEKTKFMSLTKRANMKNPTDEFTSLQIGHASLGS